MSAPREKCPKCGDNPVGQWHPSATICWECSREARKDFTKEHWYFDCPCGYSWSRLWKRADAAAPEVTP